MARPIEYTPRHTELAIEYLDSCKDSYTERDKLKVKLPSIEWLARHLQKNGLHIARSTIYEWRDNKEYQEFSDILENILSEQAERLINSSISWEYNSNIAKLLMGKHWYSDKQEIDQNIKAEVNNMSTTSTEELLKLANG